MVSREVVLEYHCGDCHRGFLFAITLDNPTHWAKPVSDGPTYCPCCGAFHNVANGPYISVTECEVVN